jgi:hypothetical protein
MDVKSTIQQIIVKLWNRQYYLAFRAPDTFWTRLQRKSLKKVAEGLAELMKRQL